MANHVEHLHSKWQRRSNIISYGWLAAIIVPAILQMDVLTETWYIFIITAGLGIFLGMSLILGDMTNHFNTETNKVSYRE